MTRSRPERVLVVGCGLIGAKRAASLPEGVELEGVHDIDVARATTFGEERGARAFGDLDALLSSTAPGALVVVATTHEALVPTTLAAIDAGHHVLVEKPGGPNAEAFAPVVEAAQRHEVAVRVGYNHRFHPSFVQIRELLANVDPGPLLNIRARYGHGGRLGYEHEWRADPTRGGGELLDQGSHLLDLSRTFDPDLRLVFGELATQFWDMSVEDNAWLALRSPSGTFAWLHATWTEWKNLFSFEVTWRSVKTEVTGLGGSYGPERLVWHQMLPEMGPPRSTEWTFDGPDRSWELEMADVLGACAGLDSHGASAEDGLAVLRLVEEARST